MKTSDPRILALDISVVLLLLSNLAYFIIESSTGYKLPWISLITVELMLFAA